MIIVVVRHRVRPDRYEQAKSRIAGNTHRMMQQPGIVFRHTGDAEGGSEIVTVTGWETDAHRAAWDALKKSSPPPGDMSDVYTGFEVIDIDVFDQRSAPIPA